MPGAMLIALQTYSAILPTKFTLIILILKRSNSLGEEEANAVREEREKVGNEKEEEKMDEVEPGEDELVEIFRELEDACVLQL